MSLVPVKEYTDPAQLLADIKERKRRFAAHRPPPPPAEERKPHPSLLGVRMKGDPEPAPDEIEPLEPAATPAIGPGHRILQEVCEAHGIPERAIKSDRRLPAVVICRREAAARMAKETTLSLKQIGSVLGQNHTTVIWQIRRFNEANSENIRNLGVVSETERDRNRRAAAVKQQRTKAQRIRQSELQRTRDAVLS